MAEPAPEELPFQITVKRMEFEPMLTDSINRRSPAEKKYLVTFAAEGLSGWPRQVFEIPVWVQSEYVAADDVVRAAKHQLHLDLADLAKQTEAFRIPDEELDQVYRTR